MADTVARRRRFLRHGPPLAAVWSAAVVTDRFFAVLRNLLLRRRLRLRAASGKVWMSYFAPFTLRCHCPAIIGLKRLHPPGATPDHTSGTKLLDRIPIPITIRNGAGEQETDHRSHNERVASIERQVNPNCARNGSLGGGSKNRSQAKLDWLAHALDYFGTRNHTTVVSVYDKSSHSLKQSTLQAPLGAMETAPPSCQTCSLRLLAISGRRCSRQPQNLWVKSGSANRATVRF